MIAEVPPHLVTTTNSAARFAYRAIGENSTTDTADELVFVEEFDAFVKRGKVPDLTNCFDGSKKQLELFEATMKRFVKNMATRKRFRSLGIDLKDPTHCDLSYVFKVATAAVEQRDGTGSLRTCKDFARKCFKSASKRHTALGAIMSMIPSDIYGSAISGGVMTILAVSKLTSKIKFGAEDQITSALASLDSSLAEFQAELDVCTQLRMGRMDENIRRIQEAAISKSNQLAINTVTDKGNNDGTASHSERNNSIVGSWLDLIGDFDASSENHVKECIRAGLGQLTLEDREKSQWIMSSGEVRNWLRLDQSSVLNIRAEEAPQGLFHSLSFTAALLAETLQKSTNYPVLSFFCGLRTNDSFDSELCGHMAVLKSLDGQLMKFCLEKRPGVDLSSLEQQKKRLIKKSTEAPKYAFRLFRELLGLLEEKDVVFVILDSWSRLLGDRTQADKIIEKLSQTTKELPNLVIKILVLDALASDAVNQVADVCLYVPEEVDCWKNDVQLGHLEQSNLCMVEELQETQRKKREDLVESDSEDSEANW
ncbi:hypothetical protein M406DRAFT_286718 [Cryphonectria parasitica EP155]|uniref:Fungal STAND N-terminal Goodbye domain-containing protein n=1 Tax=Cryphonectria parasitica (strain ATCC 38755 / EP155) TaxID=660469 RepID=A0A9P5CRY6_CRYP1|nr:uncharacterized protein M406DRAFT_286718 [Cryphonectria parasitica EP155]KAF3768738.1 hypothetical protein M406DRAFT_286718 [Cryphonectria parasitica EP155]